MFTPHTHAKVAYNKLREGSAVGTAQQARKEKKTRVVAQASKRLIRLGVDEAAAPSGEPSHEDQQ